MNAKFVDFLAEVEAFVAIGAAVCSLKTRCRENGHDASILFPDFLLVVAQTVALDVLVVPSFYFTHLLVPRQGHSVDKIEKFSFYSLIGFLLLTKSSCSNCRFIGCRITHARVDSHCVVNRDQAMQYCAAKMPSPHHLFELGAPLYCRAIHVKTTVS